MKNIPMLDSRQRHAGMTIRCLAFLFMLAFMPGISPAAELTAARSSTGRMVEGLPNQVLVRYKQGRSRSDVQTSLKRLGAAPKKRMDAINVVVADVPKGETLESFVAKLAADPNVEFAEPNGVMRVFVAPNDPQYSSQYYLASDYINVEAAWDITPGVSTIVIADIDTGVDLTHPDLSANLWVNPAPSGNSGLNGTRLEIDWDNDGDCTESDPDLGPEQCASSDPTDDNATTFHGTRIAGIMAAVTDNATNIAGVARGCRVMAVKALNADGSGSFSSIAEGILFAVNNGASVINLSLGGTTTSETVTSALNHAFSRNVVVVAAAGNSGNSTPVNFPASVDRVIAVGATNVAHALASFSCTGTALDLVAPGTSIFSTVSGGGANATNGDGTSFSAPMVTAVAALIRSLDPTMSVQDVTDHILYTATDLGSPNYDTNFGYGLLNAPAALQAAQSRSLHAANRTSSDKTYPQPNPFNPTAGINVEFKVPVALGENGMEIKIFTLAGEEVKTLTGTNVWDGKNDDGNTIASGLYLYFVKTSNGDAKGKLTVLK